MSYWSCIILIFNITWLHFSYVNATNQSPIKPEHRLCFRLGILGQVWCFIVSIPDLCPLSYLKSISSSSTMSYLLTPSNKNWLWIIHISPLFLSHKYCLRIFKCISSWKQHYERRSECSLSQAVWPGFILFAIKAAKIYTQIRKQMKKKSWPMIWVVIALSDRMTRGGNGAPHLIKHSQKIFL